MPPSGVDYASEFLNGYAPEYVIDNPINASYIFFFTQFFKIHNTTF